MKTEELILGNKYQIHAYKHNHKIYKTWDEAVLLEIHDNYLVFGNEKTKVTEIDGHNWNTKEPAVMCFMKNDWFNIIGYYKKNNIYYYCNIASPFIIEENTIKFIDYDLDVKVFPNGSFKILDKREYKYHKKIMKYPKEIDIIIKHELTKLIKLIKSKSLLFEHETVKYYIEKYKDYNNLK